ncbi:hypothetical protein FHU38_001901 [Saccharomonospora amisosensis]|uniref:Uncharacterized protein n=1 Tax=Saccharomonospora amisosensis TaxID=1128677 RepID=A0A7X5UPL6_9PSEU|nr:hypothetical protein [Saccharomonospora amisosensis]
MNRTSSGRASRRRPEGRGKGAWSAALGQGSNVLQGTAPLNGFDVYAVGFHRARNEPETQLEAHHYCRVVNDDLLECVLFDGNTRQADLVGIEYIVSERLFETLPRQEQGRRHPHNYEILSGQLAAPRGCRTWPSGPS